MLKTLVLAASCATALPGLAAAAPPAAREHVVTEIRALPGATKSPTMTLPNGRPQILVVHQAVPDGARIDVPLRVTVVIASTGSKSTTTLRPDTSYTPLSTGAGERAEIARGSGVFSVVHGALDFFQVRYGQKFTASAKGTVFTVHATRSGVTFACDQGAIDVSYAAKLHIQSGTDDALRPTSARSGGGLPTAPSAGAAQEVRAVEVITPATRRSVTFSADAPAFVKTFGTPAQAQAAFRKELIAAESSGDAERIGAAYNNLGIADDAAGAFAQAIGHFNEAIRRGPSDAIPHYNLGTTYLHQHDAARAIPEYDAAIAIEPKFAEAYVNRGSAYFFTGDRERAMSDYEQGIRLSPKLAVAHFDRGNVFLSKLELDHAIAEYGHRSRMCEASAAVATTTLDAASVSPPAPLQRTTSRPAWLSSGRIFWLPSKKNLSTVIHAPPTVPWPVG